VAWARIHKTLRVTHAMEAGVNNHLWTISDLLKEANQDTTRRSGPLNFPAGIAKVF
jgi:hypothetical protein